LSYIKVPVPAAARAPLKETVRPPSVSGPGLVFEKATSSPSGGDAFQRLHPMRKSFGDVIGGKKSSESTQLSQSFQLEPSTPTAGGLKPGSTFGKPTVTKGGKPAVPLGVKTQISLAGLKQDSGKSVRDSESSGEESSEEEDDSDDEVTSPKPQLKGGVANEVTRTVAFTSTGEELG